MITGQGRTKFCFLKKEVRRNLITIPDIIVGPHVGESNDYLAPLLLLQLLGEHGPGRHVVGVGHFLWVDGGQGVQPLLLNQPDQTDLATPPGTTNNTETILLCVSSMCLHTFLVLLTSLKISFGE